MARHKKIFTVGWLYPDLMNIYGDRGNILTLLKRAEWRDYDARLIELGRGTTKKMDEVDVFFFGGGQDREQALVYEDLLDHKQKPLERAVHGGAVLLAVCGGYQLLGEYYRTAEGERFPGIGLIDVRTEAGKRRFIGDVVVDTTMVGLKPSTLVGFENHSGRTFLGPKATPIGKVRLGFGNNGNDRTEGCLQGGVVGTYLHGSLLPKNPHLADHLIRSALRRRGVDELSPLDDSVELSAHERILERARRPPPSRAQQPQPRSSAAARPREP
ncbi:MAG: glutamine amidotransferase [Candidatus Dormibacteraeota bacterium]|nr:glutamine amidotransferase [Candidatus Dormibacteraeota bacterium]